MDEDGEDVCTTPSNGLSMAFLSFYLLKNTDYPCILRKRYGRADRRTDRPSDRFEDDS